MQKCEYCYAGYDVALSGNSFHNVLFGAIKKFLQIFYELPSCESR